jgi:Phage tail tube protein
MANGVEAYAYLARQTGRGVAATGSYHPLPYLSHSIQATEPPNAERIVGIGEGRDPGQPDRDTVTVAGDIVAPFYLHSAGLLLHMLLGDPTTTGASGNFTHVFKSGGWTLPVYTLETQTPRRDRTMRFDRTLDVMANTMQIQLATGGVERATFGMIASDQVKLAATGTGTPSAIPVAATRLLRKARIVSLDGNTAARIVGGTATYSNNLEPQYYLKNTQQDVDPGLATFTGSVDLRFDTDDMLDKAIAGTAMALELTWQIDANKSLTLRAGTIRLQRTSIPISGPGGIQVSFSFDGEKTAADGAMLVATLKNQTTSYTA